MDHPKIVGLTDAAFRLLIDAWCYCSRYLTDGKIDKTSMKRLGDVRTIRVLIKAGLIVETGSTFEMHDYLLHQRSRQQVEDAKRRVREGGARGGRQRAINQGQTLHGGAKPPLKASAKPPLSLPLSPGLANSQAQALSLAQASPKQETDTKTRLKTQDSNQHLTNDEVLLVGTTTQKPVRRATRLPDHWRPSDTASAWAVAQGIPPTLCHTELPKFRDYWHAKAGPNATKLDWDGTWRNWMRTALERAPTTNGTRPTATDKARAWLTVGVDDPPY